MTTIAKQASNLARLNGARREKGDGPFFTIMSVASAATVGYRPDSAIVIPAITTSRPWSINMKYVLAIASFGLSAWACAAMAQAPACNGAYEVVRNSVVKPGKMDLFLKAVHDHQAWYTAHGLKDRIIVGRVLGHDADSSGFSSSAAMTVHTDLSQMAPPAHAPDDAAWNRYVAEYKEASDLTNTAVVCLESSTK